VVGRADFREIGAAVSQRSITLLKDSLGLVDRLRAAPAPVTLVTMAENGTTLGATLAGELRHKGFTVRQVALSVTADSAACDSVLRSIDTATVAVIAASVRVSAGKGAIALPAGAVLAINAIAGRQPTLLISFGSPYIISQVPDVSSYLLAWVATPMSETAVANALTGAAITGRSPISIPPAWPIGTGLQRP
jgi:hypothetical protein